MASKKKGEAGYGMGDEIVVTRDDILGAKEAAGLGKVGKPKFDPLAHKSFRGVGKGTMGRFREELRHVSLADGDQITKHSSELDGDSHSPLNRLYLGDPTLNVRLHALGEDKETVEEKLGGTIELDISNLRSWVGGATHVPTRPGLAVKVVGKQRAHALPSLRKFYDPDRPHEGILTEDVEILLTNIAGIFSELLHEDNQSETIQEEGFQAHLLPTVSDREFTAYARLPGSHLQNLRGGDSFSPNQLRLVGPHALVFRGKGSFFDTNQPGIAVARLAGPNNSEGQAFAFQRVALSPGQAAVTAFYLPEGRGEVLSIPLAGQLDLRHRAVDSIAESAAGMREHIIEEARRIEAGKPISQRLTGMLRRWGVLS